MAEKRPKLSPEELVAARLRGLENARKRQAEKKAAQRAEAEEKAKREALIDEMPDREAVDEIDPDGLFTAAELTEIRKQARDTVSKERRAAKRKELLEREIDRVRQENGLPRLRPTVDKERAARLAEIIEHTIDLPEGGGVAIRIDGQMLYHGYCYPLARAVYDSVREIESRAWQHQALLDGKRTNYFTSMRQRDYGRGSEIAPRWRIAA